MQVLVVERSQAKADLDGATEKFKQAVSDELKKHPDFTDWLGLIATTVVDVGTNIAGIAKITGEFSV